MIELQERGYVVDGVFTPYSRRRRKKSIAKFAEQIIGAFGSWPFPAAARIQVFAGRVSVTVDGVEAPYFLDSSGANLVETYQNQITAIAEKETNARSNTI